MDELSAAQVNINDSFWTPRLLTNARTAIFHQWQMLEESRCIDNFRIAAGEKDGFREGWFFADSDAYKWLDAAARIYALWPSEELKALMDEFIALLSRAQMSDGYLYTYNRLHFPGERWDNLMIEHELYCHGHLIEGGVSHYEATGEQSALAIARRAADLLVRDFLQAGPSRTDGHEEIEIALLRLYKATDHTPYLELAKAFLARRGRVHPFAPLLFQQNARVEKRKQAVRAQRKAYLKDHPEHVLIRLLPENFAKMPRNSRLRWMLNALTGQYFQMHTPIRKQTVPVGHSVRFGYLETAVAMLQRLTGNQTLLPAMEKAWEQMVTRRMYVTGGLGAVPGLEGFGRDYELEPEYAYAETCAALASLFWNWEMALITGDARYSDLFEWQLYNAAAVGMGLDGDDYLYNNPLACRGGVTRRSWFAVPCCPSNLSRTWASLDKYVYSFDESNIWVHQYIGGKAMIDDGRWTVSMESGLPWEGKVRITITPEQPVEFTLHLRVPSWAVNPSVCINGETQLIPSHLLLVTDFSPTASGYDPRLSQFLPIRRIWSLGDIVELEFEMPITLRRASPKVRGHKGKVALTRGPLVYCLESVDNPDKDIFTACLDPSSLETAFRSSLLGGARVIIGKTVDGKPLTLIPYFLWANRGESQMTVWVNA